MAIHDHHNVMPYVDLCNVRWALLIEDMKNASKVLHHERSITSPLNEARAYVLRVVTREGKPYDNAHIMWVYAEDFQ